MNIKKIFSNIIVLLGCFMVFIHFAATSTTKVNQTQESENINLALRYVAHNIFMEICDSTTQIPPVKKLSEYSYSIKINKTIPYNLLPNFIDQAIEDYNLPNKYSVSLSDCASDTIRLGFISEALGNGDIPCKSREQTSQCNVIKLTFVKEQEKSSVPIFYGIGLLSLGLLGIYLSSKKTTDPIEEEIESEKQSEDLNVKLGNSTFDLGNLSLNVNGIEKTITYRESKLLNLLISNPNIILKREDIQSQVWEEEGVIVGRSLDVFISRLRKILKDDDTLNIKNIHGVGYKLEVI